MHIIGEFAQADPARDAVVTIGAFDGVHLGHQQLIGKVVARARASGCIAALITFYPHPDAVLDPERAPPCLTMPAEKVTLLESLGVDLVVLMHFDEDLMATTASEFMEAARQHLRMAELWVGSDFALGRERAGDLSHLRELGLALGFEVHVVEPVAVASETERVVSSSRIRELLGGGRVEEASRLLGRHPSLLGTAFADPRQDRGVGFLTVNLDVGPQRALPCEGVYAAYAVLGGERYAALASIAHSDGSEAHLRAVTIHMFGFDKDPSGCRLVVEFMSRLGAQRSPVGTGDLQVQVEQEYEKALRILQAWPRELESHLAAPALRPVPIVRWCSYRHEEVEHTADRAIRVWGRELPELFTGAARGMYRLMSAPEGLVSTHTRDVRLEADDLEALLVDWLNELLYLSEADGVIFSDFDIRALSPTKLIARIGGMRADPTRVGIKAATFHNLAVVREADGWSTLVTFDV